MNLEEFAARGMAAQAAVDEAVEGYTCPHCNRTSYNAHDKANRYCGGCHHFCDDVDLPYRMAELRVVQAAQALVADWRANRSPRGHGLIRAVDALDRARGSTAS